MTSTAKLRKSILKSRGIGSLQKHTRKPLSVADTPSYFHKTNTMRLVELRFNTPLDQLIFTGTIYQAAKKLGIDATTVSKWRKQLSIAKENLFWLQFDSNKIIKGDEANDHKIKDSTRSNPEEGRADGGASVQ